MHEPYKYLESNHSTQINQKYHLPFGKSDAILQCLIKCHGDNA